MATHVKIRRLEPRDADRWRELFDGYLAFYEVVLAEAVIAHTWERLLSGAEGAHIGLVAVDDTDRPRRPRTFRRQLSPARLLEANSELVRLHRHDDPGRQLTPNRHGHDRTTEALAPAA